MKSTGAVIANIRKNSIADELGLRVGDAVLAVSGQALKDYIDYRYLIATDYLSLRIQRPEQGEFLVEIEKEPDEDLGIRFTSDVFDGVRLCKCRCEFCFVAQLPKGLRPALYVRDDDYRLSFIHGNFVTLGNMREADFKRILQFHLSPLYVSVHSTEPDVRARLMGTTAIPEILPQLRRLVDGGIEIQAQIVLAAGYNDKKHLAHSVRDLTKLYPGVQSIGIVPVGITNVTPERAALRLTGATEAKYVLDQVHEWQQTYLKRLGTRLVYASDELYLQARRDFPAAEEYEDFAQLANGIGDARLFLDEIDAAGELLGSRNQNTKTPRTEKTSSHRRFRVILGTGTGASGMVSQLAARFTAAGIDTSVVVAANRFFGPEVTTAGLITGADWLHALGQAVSADLVILPRQTINADGCFLDDMTRRTFATRLGTRLAFANTPSEAAKAILRNRYQQ